MFKTTVKADRAAVIRKMAIGFEKKVSFFFQRVTERMKAIMLLPKHGYQYKWLPFRSSAPGQAPRRQFGGLERSIGKPVFSGLKAEMRITAPYAERLEFGLEGLAERPYVRASIEVVMLEMKRRGTLSQLRNRFP